jgi:hypothetical protein
MELQYRVLGKVNNAFILRGLHFANERTIDFVVKESELEFVKQRCDIADIKVLSNDQSPAIPKAVKESKNDKPRASTSSRSESTNTAKVPVVTKRGN